MRVWKKSPVGVEFREDIHDFLESLLYIRRMPTSNVFCFATCV